MITGHNTDVEFRGRVYHVQTEDKGRRNPVIETLIYSKGQVIQAVRSSYADMAGESFSDTELISRIEHQHRSCVRDVRNGKYDPDVKSRGDGGGAPELTFDELVIEALKAAEAQSPLELVMLTDVAFFEGTSVIVDLQARLGGAPEAAGGAHVKARLLGGSGLSQSLFTGRVGEDGRLTLVLEVPPVEDPPGTVIIQAEIADAAAELRKPVLAVGEGP